MQDSDRLDQLLKSSFIREITITYVRPNPDDLSGVEKRLQQRLKNINAASKEENYKALEGKSIKPDAELKELGTVALSHGSVEAVVRNEAGVIEKMSTVENPLVIATKFDPTETSAIDEVFRLGLEFLSH